MDGKKGKELGSPPMGNMPYWYAIYAQSRHEAKVEKVLQLKGLEVFLPRITTASRRRDRRLLLKLPLFPGYLFVRTSLDTADYHEVIKAPGVVRLLGNSNPMPVPEETVDSIRAVVENELSFYPWPYLEIGRQVRVLEGPLAGAVGIINGGNAKKRCLIISVELFKRSVAVELNGEAVEIVS